MKLRAFFTIMTAASLLAVTTAFAQQELLVEKRPVRNDGTTPPIPISMSGFAGEADKVVRFDLEVAGFKFVPQDQAQFSISGNSAGERLEGRLTDLLVKGPASASFAKAYSGSSTRTLAHAFADDVVLKVTGKRGIAQTQIVFKMDFGTTSEIYLSDYDGFNPVALTHDSTIVAAPAWVPGHRMVLYTSYRLGNPDIYSQDLQTGVRKAVARYTGLNTSAAVSPDGRRVAMILSKAGSPDVYVANIDGTGLVRLTQTKEDESSPCWSPDGSTICFVSRMSGRPALYTIPSTGGAYKRLATEGVSNTTEPDWSPDGKTIVFTSQMGDFKICTIPASGGPATILAAGEDPVFAPNSRTVVFARRVHGKRVLSLLDAPTKHVKDIQQTSGSSSQPCWAR